MFSIKIISSYLNFEMLFILSLNFVWFVFCYYSNWIRRLLWLSSALIFPPIPAFRENVYWKSVRRGSIVALESGFEVWAFMGSRHSIGSRSKSGFLCSLPWWFLGKGTSVICEVAVSLFKLRIWRELESLFINYC